ncbi:hypothetical protein K2X33_12080 [bacterium]|nr:hypothetical protein [bacterium]
MLRLWVFFWALLSCGLAGAIDTSALETLNADMGRLQEALDRLPKNSATDLTPVKHSLTQLLETYKTRQTDLKARTERALAATSLEPVFLRAEGALTEAGKTRTSCTEFRESLPKNTHKADKSTDPFAVAIRAQISVGDVDNAQGKLREEIAALKGALQAAQEVAGSAARCPEAVQNLTFALDQRVRNLQRAVSDTQELCARPKK